MGKGLEGRTTTRTDSTDGLIFGHSSIMLDEAGFFYDFVL